MADYIVVAYIVLAGRSWAERLPWPPGQTWKEGVFLFPIQLLRLPSRSIYVFVGLGATWRFDRSVARSVASLCLQGAIGQRGLNGPRGKRGRSGRTGGRGVRGFAWPHSLPRGLTAPTAFRLVRSPCHGPCCQLWNIGCWKVQRPQRPWAPWPTGIAWHAGPCGCERSAGLHRARQAGPAWSGRPARCRYLLLL